MRIGVDEEWMTSGVHWLREVRKWSAGSSKQRLSIVDDGRKKRVGLVMVVMLGSGLLGCGNTALWMMGERIG